MTLADKVGLNPNSTNNQLIKPRSRVTVLYQSTLENQAEFSVVSSYILVLSPVTTESRSDGQLVATINKWI